MVHSRGGCAGDSRAGGWFLHGGGDRCLHRQCGPHHSGGGDWLVRAHHEPHPHGNCVGPAGRRSGQVRHAGLFCGRDQSVAGTGHAARLSAFAAYGSALCGHHHLAGRNRLGGAARADAVVGRAWRAGHAGLYGTRVLAAGSHQSGFAPVCRDHGFPESAGRGGDSCHGLSDTGVQGHQHDGRGDLAAGAFWRLCPQPQCNYGGDLHGR
ncbi:hypothetical protein SDC9_182823 [bioreactor metagenome]|uniref:Uncharacterized protein n=1 Tax=bioreactor metagenome TaxID=1076179 RepID=A0A645H9X3_9ZZZZ